MPPPAASTCRTRRRSWSSMWTRTRSSARSRRRQACTASRSRPSLGKGFVSNGRENCASIVDLKTLQITRIGQDRGEPGLHPLRARTQGGLHVQRARQLGDGVRRRDGRREGHHRAAGQAGVRRRRREGRPHLQQHRGHERDRRHRHEQHTRWWRSGPSRRVKARPGWRSTSAHHRLFTVAGNRLLVALDSATGKVLSTLPIGPGVDAAAYRSGYRARVRVEQRQHADRGQSRRRGETGARSDARDAGAIRGR